tara:strand:+ start:259 stop:609 length:351 start_codon:yes stop_codon:yes gene_type:complete
METKYDRIIRNQVIETLEEVVGIQREYWEIKRTKKKDELLIRQVYCYLLNKYSQLSLQFIADLIGLKYHSSVIRTMETVQSWINNPEENPKAIYFINEFEKLYEQRTNNNTQSSAE